MPRVEYLGERRLTLRMLEKKTLNCEINVQGFSDGEEQYVDTPLLEYSWLRNGKVISNVSQSFPFPCFKILSALSLLMSISSAYFNESF